MNLDNQYPVLLGDVSIRRYGEIELFDFTRDESYEIDEETLDLLRMADGTHNVGWIINQYPEEKRDEVEDALVLLHDLKIIEFSETKVESEDAKVTDFLITGIPSRNSFHPPYLRSLMVNLTERCNLACQHCFISEKHPVDIPLDKLKDILKDFYRLQGMKLILTGGEPLLYQDLRELLDFLQAVPMQKMMLTNGTLIPEKPEIVSLMRDAIHKVFVSIDGLEATHDELRQGKCFKRAIEGIGILQENGIKVCINTMLHKQNLGEIDKLEAFIKTLGAIESWVVDVPTFDDSYHQSIIDKYAITRDEARGIYGRHGWGSGFEMDAGDLACGPAIMAVDALGVVTKCGFFKNESVGNIFDLGVRESWLRVQERLNWCVQDLKCKAINCEFIDACRGGCRYRAFVNTGDILGIDGFKCVQYDTKASQGEE